MVETYRRRGVFLDTNLLLLFVVGLRSSERVRTHRKLQAFVPDDAEALYRFCGRFPRIVTMPHVLTQASDLLQDDDQLSLKRVVDLCEEEFIPSREVTALHQYPYMGLADAAILGRIAGSFLVLSDDGRLVHEVRRLEGGALEFDWVRAIAI